jgi:hypothetical protein
MITNGYLYCMTNACMPNLLKIGMTERTPDERLKDANSPDTWRPPVPYVIEFAKQVTNPKQKETTLHRLLEQYTERVHPRREFFRLPIEDVRTFFDLMDGEYWVPNDEVGASSSDQSAVDEEVSESDRQRLTSFIEAHYTVTGKSDDKMKTKDVYLLYSVYDKSAELIVEREFARVMSKCYAKKGNYYLGLRPKVAATAAVSSTSSTEDFKDS